MSIASDLEKLTSLRDQGALSPTEFVKAKELLLSEENTEGNSVCQTTSEKKKQSKTQLLVANLLTLTAAMSVASVIINPSPIKLVSVILWTVASTLAWSAYFTCKKKLLKQG